MAEEPEKIIINGQEYSLSDVAGLVEKGNKYNEIERETNTQLDKVFPEFTRKSQQLKDLEGQLSQRDSELSELRKAQENLRVAETPEEIRKAKEALRGIGGVDEDYLKSYLSENGYMTRDEALKQAEESRIAQQQLEQLNKQGYQLEKEIDGSDGRTPFIYRNVLAYANAYHKDDLMSAYNEMNERVNKSWQEARLAEEAAKHETPTIQIRGGHKEPEKTKVTNDNLTANLQEIAKGLLD